MNVRHPDCEFHAWLPEPLPADVKKSLERLAAIDDVRHLAIMPDVHLAGDVCIGTVLATTRTILPAAVGGDIGCGMAAVRFDAEADVIRDENAAARVLAGLYDCVPTNRHRQAKLPQALPAELDALPLSDRRLEKLKSRDGRVQIGTLGRGNHFVELQSDQENRLWLMVHTGSRAMGQAITAHHTDNAPRVNGVVCLNAESEPGRNYLVDVEWALAYAEQNRLAIVSAVAALLKRLFRVETNWGSLIHANHNHVRLEEHAGRTYYVHRKGAQSARCDEAGIVPGSMGTASFHVAGRGCTESLHSCSHGAGRKMSRVEARRNISIKKLHQQLKSVWFDVRMAAALREEAPVAYKDVYAVMRAQKPLTRMVRELRPLLCYKGR